MATEKVIYTKKVAYKLRQQGFPIVRVEVNPNKPQFDCYVFEDTKAFRQALTTISKD